MTDAVRSFAGDFPPADLAAWTELARAALNGADPARLERTTLDGLKRGPLFTAADRPETLFRRAEPRDPFTPWAMRQPVELGSDPKTANAAILADLAGGGSEVRLGLNHADHVAGRTPEALSALLAAILDGVMLDLAPVHLAPSDAGLDIAAAFLNHLKNNGSDLSIQAGGLGLSPVSRAALNGTEAELGRAAALAATALRAVPRLTVFVADATVPHEAGASEAQEIAFALAEGAAYLRALIDAGVAPADAAQAIEFSFAVDADIHLNIAKLRAARRCWARVIEAHGADPATPMALHALSSLRMMGRRDPWPNLVRAACAGFAAAAGGADALTIRPATDAIGGSTRFSRRIARNIHILLAEEAHAGRAADPAGGAFLHEALGDSLAAKAWDILREAETERAGHGGGFCPPLWDWWARRITDVREARLSALSTGRTSLIGVSQYADPAPRPLDSEPRPEAPAPAGLAPHRLAEPFEALWDSADAHAAKTGERPASFLATIGPLARFNARSGFAANRLAIGGVSAPAAEAHDSLDACADAFAASLSPLAVICGDDEGYADHAAALVKLLKDKGAEEVWVAGRPDPALDADHFIHARSDALADLARAHEVLGVKS